LSVDHWRALSLMGLVEANLDLIRSANLSLTSACPLDGLVALRLALPPAGQIVFGGNNCPKHRRQQPVCLTNERETYNSCKLTVNCVTRPTKAEQTQTNRQ